MFYTFNIFKFVRQMLPPLLRSGALIALLEVMVTPLKSLYERFISYRATTSDALNINGHVLPLETALNKACYITGEPSIYLESTNVQHTQTLYYVSEGQSPTYLYMESEDEALTLSFQRETPEDTNIIVHVPSTYYTDAYLTIIRNLMNRYKPAGRTYDVVKITNA